MALLVSGPLVGEEGEIRFELDSGRFPLFVPNRQLYATSGSWQAYSLSLSPFLCQHKPGGSMKPSLTFDSSRIYIGKWGNLR
jgi:hypothetical protein